MVKRLEGNGLWEASRTMLSLDERRIEEIIRSLAVAMFTEKDTVVTVWSEFEDQTFRGQITKLDQKFRKIKIENDEEYSWIDFDDIVNIEIIIDEMNT
ncbi:MAG: hypothetical protein K0S39_6168 [Paenibacillus sp.]|nr:hypothetical protein [Paenibacillus sp.]